MSRFNWALKAWGIFVLWATVAIALPAQTFTSLVSFDFTNGDEPSTRLLQGTDGNFYGTTTFGANLTCLSGCGTVFKITPSGTLTTLHSFGETDGQWPRGGLIQGTDGNFYGTTTNGGVNGGGTVFTITPSGTLTTLYNFCSEALCADGELPYGGLIQVASGSFYGTTSAGGANDICEFGCGTVFAITPSGKLTTLHSFGYTDGYNPMAGLVQASDGNLYGTTTVGGANDTCEDVFGEGCGTVFSITQKGALATLHSFDYTDGEYPEAVLVQGADGNLYGSTYGGGSGNINFCAKGFGCGTVFKITLGGTLTTLYNFCLDGNDCPDGWEMQTGMVQGTDGNFYGVTTLGGANYTCFIDFVGGCGTVFRITPSGTLTTLHAFDSTDGNEPSALLQDTNGGFYGATGLGGSSSACASVYLDGCGTIFSLSVGLGPFVKTQPASGKVGAAVNILGTNLTGATSVTFNGIAAVFTVKASTLITTTVPTGATSGTVQVVTPTRTLKSNMRFMVK